MPSRKPFQDIANLNIKSANTQAPNAKHLKSRTNTNICNFTYQNLHINTHRHIHSEYLLVNLKVITSLHSIIQVIVKILERKKYRAVWIVMNERLVNELFETRINTEYKYGDHIYNEGGEKLEQKDRSFKNGSCGHSTAYKSYEHADDHSAPRPFRSIPSLPSIFAPLYTLPGYQAHFEYQQVVTKYDQRDILMYRVERMEKEQ